MSWVCPMCSTNNEESESKCIVCEYERVSDKICTLTYNKVQKLRLSGNVVIPEEFNVIGEGAFKGRTDVYSVTLHDNVRKISKEAFSGCSNLRSIISGCELETVSIKAFAECTSLTTSARVKAKYVAKDAYYITPKPVYTPSPPPRTTPTPSSVRTAPVDTKTYKTETDWSKRVAQLVLLGLCSLVLTPLANLFSSAFQDGENSGYSTFIGVALLLLLISAIYSRFIDEDGKAFSKETKIIPAIVVLLISYVMSVIWSDSLRWVNVYLSSALLLGELIFLGKTIYKENYRFIAILICLIITNSLMVWRIIVA